MTRSGMHDTAVSEVISTVLMVAITVIIAAIIASLIFGLAWIPGFGATAVTAERSGTDITFTNHGGAGFDEIQEITCWVGGTTPGVHHNVTLGTEPGSTAVNTYGTAGPDRVVVVGRFYDGTEQVLLDRTI
ncbi:type IV pilin [Methanoculleus frigidifontis]|nr:type IV pilin [Methanoculleus sp. FWC-SCC1]